MTNDQRLQPTAIPAGRDVVGMGSIDEHDRTSARGTSA